MQKRNHARHTFVNIAHTLHYFDKSHANNAPHMTWPTHLALAVFIIRTLTHAHPS